MLLKRFKKDLLALLKRHMADWENNAQIFKIKIILKSKQKAEIRMYFWKIGKYIPERFLGKSNLQRAQNHVRGMLHNLAN